MKDKCKINLILNSIFKHAFQMVKSCVFTSRYAAGSQEFVQETIAFYFYFLLLENNSSNLFAVLFVFVITVS